MERGLVIVLGKRVSLTEGLLWYGEVSNVD
jgi:hypothetical protein